MKRTKHPQIGEYITVEEFIKELQKQPKGAAVYVINDDRNGFSKLHSIQVTTPEQQTIEGKKPETEMPYLINIIKMAY